MTLRLAIVSMVLSCFAFQTASAADKRPTLVVGNPNFRAYPIAVPDARADDNVQKPIRAVTDTLRWDLSVSPIFKVLDPKGYLADSKKEAKINFSDWVSIGADGLVKVAVSGGATRYDMRFYDVASGREQIAKTYRGTEADAERFAHEFANEIVFALTGTKGIFNTKIAAVVKTSSGRELVVVDVNGRNLRRATSNGSINLLPAWSADGRLLLFTSYMRHNPNLFSIGVGGDRPKLLSGERGLNTGGAMSPDGSKIALTLTRDGNSEIYVMNSDGTNLRRLTNEWAIDSSPSWSPDGKRIAFVSSRWGDPHIFLMNSDGSGVRRLTDRGTYNQTPDWSPRGDAIAFTARDERNKFDIFTVNPETKEIRRLTQDEGNNEEPAFSPDGNNIVFTSTREGKSQIWIMAWDGSNQLRITAEGDYSTPDWSPYL